MRLGIGAALAVASVAATVGMAAPASAGVSDCPDWGVACAFRDVNYNGPLIWQEGRPGYYSFDGANTTTSFINRTGYTVKLVSWNNYLGLCFSPGVASRDLPKEWDDNLRAIEIEPYNYNGCTHWA
ncbi:peptidase inhibitor family I36 protein [Lentzea sp. NPDC004782]|uniref:peptidase inhibitor family I36 protein n=1 Tax=Lentzea sp. NPDC004782 TaxID=3154458 RepID=UPI0033A79B86